LPRGKVAHMLFRRKREERGKGKRPETTTGKETPSQPFPRKIVKENSYYKSILPGGERKRGGPPTDAKGTGGPKKSFQKEKDKHTPPRLEERLTRPSWRQQYGVNFKKED